MIVLKSPKGWTGPKEVDQRKVEGFWRSHQVPLATLKDNPAHLKQLEDWLRSYEPDKLFGPDGRLNPELKNLAPKGRRRMSANPHANGGLLRRVLRLPDFREYAVDVPKPGAAEVENTRPLGRFLRDVMALNPGNFRVFGPDETTSNKLDDIYEASKKTWLADYLPEDADGGELSPDGRVMECSPSTPWKAGSKAISSPDATVFFRPMRPSSTSSTPCSTSTPSGWTSPTTFPGARRSRR
jgi:xylulose-5-phosphate/fructose-6-phosphate phosphoketolase